MKYQGKCMNEHYDTMLREHLDDASFLTSDTFEENLVQLCQKLNNEEQEKNSLKQKLEANEECLNSEKDRLHKLQDQAVQERWRLHQHICQLRRGHLDLVEQLEKGQTELANVKSELSASRDLLTRTTKLEETLAAALSSHQIDLKDIWRLFQKDIEAEGLLDGEEHETPITVSSDSVKDQVTKEICLIKTQLAKTQAALAAHAAKNLSLGDVQVQLSEALTLDCFNPKATSSSAQDILENMESSSSNSILNLSNHVQSRSCPLLLPNNNHVTCSTQTDTDTMYGINKCNNSNSVLSCRSSSAVCLDNNPKRKGLLAVYAGADNVYSVAVSHHEPGTTATGITRERSSSFKAAIEKGAKPTSVEINIPETMYEHSSEAPYATARNLESYHYVCTNNSPPVYRVSNMTNLAAVSDSNNSPISKQQVNVKDDEEENNNEEWSSPCHNRKLSILIEQPEGGSDFDAEGSLTESVTGLDTPSRSRSSKAESDQQYKTLLPKYKNPPDYQNLRDRSRDKSPDCRLMKQNHISPGNTPGNTPRNLSPITVQPEASKDNNKQKGPVTFKLDSGLTVPQVNPVQLRLSPVCRRSALTSNNNNSDSDSPPVRRSVLVNTDGDNSTTKRSVTDSNNIPIVRSHSTESNRTQPTSVRFKLEKSYSDETHGGSAFKHSGVQTSPYRLSQHSKPEADRIHVSPATSHAWLPPGTIKDSRGLLETDLDEVDLSEVDKIISSQTSEDENRKMSLRHRPRRLRRVLGSSDYDTSMTMSDGSVSFDDSEDSFDHGPHPPKISVEAPSTDSPLSSRRSSLIQDQDFLEADIRRDVFSQSNDPDVSSNRRPTCNVQLARIREEHLLKKKVLKHAAMPELAETSETESVKGGSMDSGSETPSDKDHPVFPSLPDPVLKKLGLLGDDGESAENLSEQELEEKFAMLSLSFKTDRLTLDQRVQLQERARDMAEQNVDKELKSVKESLKLLGQQCVTSEGREVLAKVQRHVEVLEQSTARVSSRAELHGAVQQEGRLSRAIEIMVQHVETIKQAYERKDQELEETRQLLQENRIIPPSGSTDYGDGHPGFSKRSMSVAGGAAKNVSSQGHHHLRAPAHPQQANSTTEMGRRRASVAAFPRLFGGVGQSGSTMINLLKRVQKIGGPRRFSADPRSRLQPTFSTTARTCSLEQKDQKQTPENVKNLQVKPSVEKPLSDCNKDANANEKKTVDWGPEEKEQIFQKGFEQGMRTGLSQDLNGFREQQAAFGEGLEELMDLNDLPDEEDEEFETETLLEKVWQLVPEWDKLGHKLRLLLVGLVAFMAVISIIYTVMPSLSPVQASQCRPCWSKSLADSLLNMYTTKQWIMKPPT
ncbi:uncharacterized protein LOC141899953 [Tubulanus polymorphus]|uniref:uncharacterized protein LOC141899953 n=1 Tax=Tubulanus polymorphus TaxID=672921 RepID=UPI003DA48A91